MRRIWPFCIIALPIISLGASGQELPAGPGKDVVQRMCSTCHGLDVVIGRRMTEERWANTVDVMVSRGANGTDEEIDLVIAYLARNFGSQAQAHKINVNRATAKELAAGLGLTANACDAIVQYRGKNGDFKNLADLRKVPEIPSKTVDDLKDRIEF